MPAKSDSLSSGAAPTFPPPILQRSASQFDQWLMRIVRRTENESSKASGKSSECFRRLAALRRLQQSNRMSLRLKPPHFPDFPPTGFRSRTPGPPPFSSIRPNLGSFCQNRLFLLFKFSIHIFTL
jgi:hypothetical protein